MKSSLPLHQVVQEWDYSYKFMPSCKKNKSLTKKYSSFFSNRRDIPEAEPKPENSMEGIYPLLKEFKNIQEDTDPVQRNMDVNVLQKLNNDRDRRDQRSRKMEGLLGLALQAINEMEFKIQELSITKAKRALMAPKQLCPKGLNIRSIERKNSIGEKDEATLTKLREWLIKKSRDYRTSFPKYNGNLKQGQTWCPDICYHAIGYIVDTIAVEDVKFVIYEAIETTMSTRVLHLEPGTIGFNSFTPEEYLEEMLGRFMNKRTKGGAKEEFEQKVQGVNEEALEYYDTNLQLYLHSYDD